MRMKLTLLLPLLFLLTAGGSAVKGSHLVGADIAYTCVNNCSLLVTLKAYRDCDGSPSISPTPLIFTLANGNCTASGPVPVNAWSTGIITELAPLCNSFQVTRCSNPGSPYLGIQEYRFERLYDACGLNNCVYDISWSTCCRSPVVSAIPNPGSTSIYIEGPSLNTNFPCNNSPIFDPNQPPFVCAGQPSQFSMSATDPDGDSLTYSLTNCYDQNVIPLTYNPGFSPQTPLGPSWNVNLDPVTGNFTMIPNPGNNEVGVVCVEASEWRNGQLIGTTVRDYMMAVINCPNALCGDNLAEGVYFKEDNNNCQQDAGEPGLNKRKLLILPDSVMVESQSNGYYAFAPKAGTYTVVPVPPANNLWINVCPPPGSYTITFPGSNDTISGLDFGDDAAVDCPAMWVDIGSNIVRPCFQTEYSIEYCNNGTDSAYNAFIELTLDTNYTIDSASIPFVTGSNGAYVFNVGNLGITECGQFNVWATLACDTALVGEVFCAEAHAFPDTTCLPPDPIWDKSSVQVSGTCQNDTVCFTVLNTGSPSNGNMQGPTNWRFYVNAQLTLQGTLQLCGGCDTVFCFPGNGQDYRFEVDQRPGHPGNSNPNAVVQGCGNPNNPVNFTLNQPLDDGDEFIAIDCRPAVNAYDPNEKYVIPRGVTSQYHYINKTDILEYMIDFQNTGNANAWRVVLKDTLSPLLDLTTIVPGASSHPYSWKINTGRELEFTFDNIQLVPEQVDPVASIGYVKFKIRQASTNTTGDRIENFADIYFDFNAPIRTNTTFNTIGRVEVVSVDFGEEPLDLAIYPNPTNGEVFAEVRNLMDGTPLQLEFYSLMGQKVVSESFEAGQLFQVSLDGLPQGVYVYRILDGEQMLQAGKIILK